MQTIRFRAKAKYDNRWVYGFYLERDGYDKGMIYERNGMGHDVDPKTVGQYIGLTDKNGREIFAGDILKWTSKDEESFELYEVLYRDDLAAFATRLIGRKVTPELSYFNTGMAEDTDTDDIEVIGDVYSSPELLTGEA